MAGEPVRDALLSWYDVHRRDLPWRRARDPYAIWVSEVMLQQTRVETVVPYFERFMERFPTPAALAGASEDEVMAAWSGLGYYRRARLLHSGVREVVARYGGRVPGDAEARRALPGVGRYTAGAIGSIAFGAEEPIVDGNVARVLARVHGIATPLGKAETERALWAVAGELVRGPRPGDLNQALMELGATVCTPAGARCDACPIARACVARREGRTEELPVPRARKAPLPVALVAVVATSGRPPRTWLQRVDGALFGGLWAPPTAEGDDRAAARRALAEAGLCASLEHRARAEIEHVLSHRRLTVRVFAAARARPRGRRASEAASRAFTREDLDDVGVSRLTWNILEAAAR